jgi:hypothetical protein
MLTRHVVSGNDYVAAGIATDAKAARRHDILAPIDERHESATRHTRARTRRRDWRRGRFAECRHDHSAACFAVVGEAELTPGHLDPVSVEQWCRFCTERHIIHKYRGARRYASHGRGSTRVHDDDRESPLLWTSIEPNTGIVARPDPHLANAQLDLVVVKPNVRHAVRAVTDARSRRGNGKPVETASPPRVNGGNYG